MSLVSPAAPRKPIGMSGVGKRETKRGARSSPKTSMARTGSLPPTDLSSPWPAAGSDAGAGGDAGIRTSCVACGLRKRRCERALHAPSCVGVLAASPNTRADRSQTRCSRLGIPCEYVAKEKPGPKRDPNSQSSWTARERAALLRKSATSSSREESSPEASDSSSSPQTVSIGTIATTASPATDWAFTVHPGLGDQNQALTVLPEAAQTPFTPAVDPDLVHLLNNFPDISNRFAFPEAPDVDSGGFTAAGPASLAPAFWTPAPADVLPDQELLNLLLSGSFFGRVHVAFPHAILPELMVELRTPHTIPDYGLFSIMFLAARWASARSLWQAWILPSVVGEK